MANETTTTPPEPETTASTVHQIVHTPGNTWGVVSAAYRKALGIRE
jgi:hypothetical protein